MIPADELDAILAVHNVSAKEKMVLKLALNGMPINEIAEHLEIMPDAARKRLGEIYRKFGIKGRGSGKLAKLQHILFSQHQMSEGSSPAVEVQSHDAPPRPSPRAPVEWGNAPDLPQFFGRESEIATLSQAVLDQDVQLISIIGMKGIGKTALALKIVEDLPPHFEGIFWRSLDGKEMPDLSSAMQDFISYVREKPLPEGEDPLEALMDCLRLRRFLVIFDGIEPLIAHSDTALNQTSAFQNFIQRVGSERHLSCVLLTSRENPKEITELEGLNFPVKSIFLEGLSGTGAKQFLSAKELSNQTYWDELIHIFQGNPLALQLIAVRIQRFFGGDVGEFLKQETITLRQIDDLIAHQFHALADNERKVLFVLASKDEALSFNVLKTRPELGLTGSELLETLESLLRRSLVQGEMQFVIHPTVKKYIHHLLRQVDFVTMPEKDADIPSYLEGCLRDNPEFLERCTRLSLVH